MTTTDEPQTKLWRQAVRITLLGVMVGVLMFGAYLLAAVIQGL